MVVIVWQHSETGKHTDVTGPFNDHEDAISWLIEFGRLTPMGNDPHFIVEMTDPQRILKEVRESLSDG